MEPVRVITGRLAPLDRADVDTDQIMPKQFLARTERTGFGEFLFHTWRQDPAFVLNDDRYEGATVLVTGPNFGCGSSREHAPWGLQQYGFAAVIAPSFADIFRINCEKIGLLAVQLPGETCSQLLREATEDPGAVVRIDLAEQDVRSPTVTANFDIDPFTKRCLLEGLDDIALTLRHEVKIAAFEAARSPYLPVAGR